MGTSDFQPVGQKHVGQPALAVGIRTGGSLVGLSPQPVKSGVIPVDSVRIEWNCRTSKLVSENSLNTRKPLKHSGSGDQNH